MHLNRSTLVTLAGILAAAPLALADDPVPCAFCSQGGSVGSQSYTSPAGIYFEWEVERVQRGVCVERAGVCDQPATGCLFRVEISWRNVGGATVAGTQTNGTVTSYQGQTLADEDAWTTGTAGDSRGEHRHLSSLTCGNNATFTLSVVHEWGVDPNPKDDVPPPIVSHSPLVLTGTCARCDDDLPE
jgi:hypothetical protein